MADMEKVFKGLDEAWHSLDEWSINGTHFDIQIVLDQIYDALELLKEHNNGGSFIVIDTKTGEEADIYNIALHEDWAKHLCYCDMDGWAIEDDGSLLLLDECGRYAYADRERFKVKWE